MLLEASAPGEEVSTATATQPPSSRTGRSDGEGARELRINNDHEKLVEDEEEEEEANERERVVKFKAMRPVTQKRPPPSPPPPARLRTFGLLKLPSAALARLLPMPPEDVESRSKKTSSEPERPRKVRYTLSGTPF